MKEQLSPDELSILPLPQKMVRSAFLHSGVCIHIYRNYNYCLRLIVEKAVDVSESGIKTKPETVSFWQTASF